MGKCTAAGMRDPPKRTPKTGMFAEQHFAVHRAF